MTQDAAFSVQDFLEAITAQLDQTQDALRLKSVNRPLTYAIRDFSMELKVFVELAGDGRVMFRPSAGDDAGASVVHIGFTTVNRTMIEENTVDLTSVRSPTLDELGLDAQERRQLERLGVRNAAQLDHLRSTTGEVAVARFSGLPVSRLREALAQSRPTVRAVTPVTEPAPATDGLPARVRLPLATRRLVVDGPRLSETVQARLGGRPLALRQVDGGVEVDLGDDAVDGQLDLDLGHEDGGVSLALEFEPAGSSPPPDPWRSP